MSRRAVGAVPSRSPSARRRTTAIGPAPPAGSSGMARPPTGGRPAVPGPTGPAARRRPRSSTPPPARPSRRHHPQRPPQPRYGTRFTSSLSVGGSFPAGVERHPAPGSGATPSVSATSGPTRPSSARVRTPPWPPRSGTRRPRPAACSGTAASAGTARRRGRTAGSKAAAAGRRVELEGEEVLADGAAGRQPADRPAVVGRRRGEELGQQPVRRAGSGGRPSSGAARGQVVPGGRRGGRAAGLAVECVLPVGQHHPLAGDRQGVRPVPPGGQPDRVRAQQVVPPIRVGRVHSLGRHDGQPAGLGPLRQIGRGNQADVGRPVERGVGDADLGPVPGSPGPAQLAGQVAVGRVGDGHRQHHPGVGVRGGGSMVVGRSWQPRATVKGEEGG